MEGKPRSAEFPLGLSRRARLTPQLLFPPAFTAESAKTTDELLKVDRSAPTAHHQPLYHMNKYIRLYVSLTLQSSILPNPIRASRQTPKSTFSTVSASVTNTIHTTRPSSRLTLHQRSQSYDVPKDYWRSAGSVKTRPCLSSPTRPYRAS